MHGGAVLEDEDESANLNSLVIGEVRWTRHLPENLILVVAPGGLLELFLGDGALQVLLGLLAKALEHLGATLQHLLEEQVPVAFGAAHESLGALRDSRPLVVGSEHVSRGIGGHDPGQAAGRVTQVPL